MKIQLFSTTSSISVCDQKGLQILQHSCSEGDIEFVKLLLSCGADPSGGLQAALEYYHQDIVKLLIKNKADVNKVISF